MAYHSSNHHAVKIIEQCEVAPPPGSLPSQNLPLTFFDIPWFYCHPVQRIFFFHFPHPINHFLQEALPPLKNSLSLTLQHFFPFAANLIIPPQPEIPFIRYNEGDFLHFTLAESTADFTLLISDSPQDVRDWHPLVPSLPPERVEEDATRVIPLTAIQVTVLPNAGFSICLTFNHLVGDGKSLHHFIKFWASLCKERVLESLASNFEEGSLSLPLPSHDRDRVKDPKGLKHLYLQELRDSASKKMEFAGLVQDVYSNKLRTTVVLSREQVEKLKKSISLKYSTTRNSGESHISTFVVTCSLIWVCMIQSEHNNSNIGNCVVNESNELCYLVFLADCRGRPELSIPSTYFGNCLATCIVKIKRSVMVGENGIFEVANAIEREIGEWKRDPLKRAETLMSDYKELGESGKSILVVAGSPKLEVYKTDFGWGKPNKSESVHLDTSGSISLSDCKDKEGAIEVGLALERNRLNDFINILEERLSDL